MIDDLTYEPRIRRRIYKTHAGQKRAMKRYGSRVESWGASSSDGYLLWVYDLDEFGQAPAQICPCCGSELEGGDQ